MMMMQRNYTLLLLALFFSAINQTRAFEPVTQDSALDMENRGGSLFSFHPQRLLATLKRFYGETTTKGTSRTLKDSESTTATRANIGRVVKRLNPKQTLNNRTTIFAQRGSITPSKAPAINTKAASLPTLAVVTTLGSAAVTAAPTPSRGSTTTSNLGSSTTTSTRASARIKMIGMGSGMGGGSGSNGMGMIFTNMGGMGTTPPGKFYKNLYLSIRALLDLFVCLTY